MADSILIRFATAQLDKARETAKQIAKQVRDTAKQLKDLPPEVRKAFREAARNAQKQREEEIREQARRLDLLKRSVAIQGRDLSQAALVSGQINLGKKLWSHGSMIFNVAASGNLFGAINALEKVPGVGLAAGGVAAVAAIVLPILQRELDAKLAAMEIRSRVREERALFESDVARRFREDVRFRDQMIRRAVREEQIRDAALRSGRWRRRGRFLIGE